MHSDCSKPICPVHQSVEETLVVAVREAVCGAALRTSVHGALFPAVREVACGAVRQAVHEVLVAAVHEAILRECHDRFSVRASAPERHQRIFPQRYLSTAM